MSALIVSSAYIIAGFWPPWIVKTLMRAEHDWLTGSTGESSAAGKTDRLEGYFQEYYGTIITIDTDIYRRFDPAILTE